MKWWVIVLSLAACDGSDPMVLEAGSGVDMQLDASPDTTVDADLPTDPSLPAACMEARPCGGDPTGEWTWTAWCQDTPPSPIDACLVADQTTAVLPAGTAEFRADGSWSMTATYTIRRTTRLPMECLSSTCEAAGADLDAERDWQCTPMGEACHCTADQALPGDDAGTYAIDGDRLTTIGAAGEARPLWFCVTDDRLVLRDLDADQPEDPVFILHRQAN